MNPAGYGRDQETCLARLNRVRYLTEMGYSREQIAREIGVNNVQTVSDYRRRAREGWVPTVGGDPAAYTAENAKRIAKLYESGLTQRQVAARTGLTYNQVRRIMVEFGVPRRPQSERRRLAWKTRRGGGPEGAS